jgi:hypothetical protein
MKFRAPFAAVCSAFLAFNATAATTHYVSLSNTAPMSPFTNWVTAATNIQDAIDAANADDFIVVTDGTYNTGGRAVYGLATNRVTLDKAVTVQSVNGPGTTVIAGAGNLATPGIRCVYLTNGAALIGFTLTNGATRFTGDVIKEQSGGGVWCESSSASVSNCVLAGNSAHQGGLGAGGGAFGGTLLSCILTNNVASQGGGAYSNTLINCTVVGNFAAFQNLNSGGGAYACTLSNCLLMANRCNGGGGGAFSSTLSSCVLSNNTANNGGGVCFGTINNSLISSNRAFSSGGGAYSNILINCIVENNFASGDGGGTYNSLLNNCTVISNTATLAVAAVFGGGIYGGSGTNCIIYYNYVAGGGSNFFSTNLSYCDTSPLPTNGFGNIPNAPAFVNLAGEDFHLQSGSPCINAGNNSSVAGATDLDGNPRIVGGTVDIGAYEYQTPTSIISYAWLQQYGLPTGGSADFADSDGDSFNNWQEWHAGMNPGVPASQLQMFSPAPTNDSSGITISWQSVSGINYFVQRGCDLSAQPAFSGIQSNIVGQAGTTSFTDTTATNCGPYFYRVGVP